MTGYVVLKQIDEETWRVLDENVLAHSADKAIRRVVDPSGSYIAIPMGKWNEPLAHLQERIRAA